jgi:hypothetical protein
MKVCGIDPGNNGALCVLDSQDLGHPSFMDFNKKTKYEIAIWLNNRGVEIFWIEDVKSIFGMSARSNFGFGKSLGIAHTIAELISKDKFARVVTPKVWQKYIGVSVKGKEIKKQVAQIGQSIYPGAIVHGSKGGLLDGRSDALMIAHYGLNHS